MQARCRLSAGYKIKCRLDLMQAVSPFHCSVDVFLNAGWVQDDLNLFLKSCSFRVQAGRGACCFTFAKIYLAIRTSVS